MKKTEKLKQKLANMFDDSLKTEVWQNVVDYVIIGLILISTIEVILSSFPKISLQYGHILHFIDISTTLIFSVEVAIRIWVAGYVHPEYSGLKGRLKYCLTFYGFIDIISTYTFYLGFFFNLPVYALKSLRIVRLLRIFRYMESFKLLRDAIRSKKEEMLISLQFLCIITLLLSFILFFVENSVQPEVYSDMWQSVIWAFAQYIGDPGHFAEFEPITIVGRLISCVIGVLGIAIFAVPAGLIGSGFLETVEALRHEEDLKNCREKLHCAFERKLCRFTAYQFPPIFVSFDELTARVGLKPVDIIETIGETNDYRIINLFGTKPIELDPQDKLAVEHFVVNTSYGCCIDRGSDVTIVSPSNIVDPSIGYFSYFMAKMLGFNYVSRELGESRPYHSFYLNNYADTVECQDFNRDVNRLANKPNSWVFVLMAASGANEPEYPSQIHVAFGGSKGDETLESDDLLVHNVEDAKHLYEDISQTMKNEFSMETDCQRYHNTSSPKLFLRHLSNRNLFNGCMIRVAWSHMLWSSDRMLFAKKLGEVIARNCSKHPLKEDPEMKIKNIGYSDYKN